MAFGKVRAPGAGPGKMNMRQQMKKSTYRPPRGGGGGGGNFRNRYLPPVTGPADLIRIIPGAYPTPRIDTDNKDYYYNEAGAIITDPTPYWKYVDYFHGVKQRGIISSEGPLGIFKGKGDPCIAADWYWWEWRQRNKHKSKTPNAMRRSEKWAFTVLVQAPFYKVPQTDDKGDLRINPHTKEPYYEWVKGSKKGNDELAAGGYERKEGHLMHWSMSYGHWAVIQTFSDSLSKHCRSCGGADTIEELALLCQHCKEAVVEMDSTSLDEEDLERLRCEEVRCPHCGVTDYLEDMVECNACGHGDPSTLFDFDLKVKRVETAQQDGGKQTTLQITGALGPRPIADVYGEDLRTPLDLPKIFTPDSLERQEELFGLPPGDDDVMTDAVPKGVVRKPVSQGSRAYGKSRKTEE